VNQRSGVSVRLTVANHETLCAAAVRRALRRGETLAVPRVSDLDALMASTQGKIEIEALDEREGSVVEKLLKASVLTVFKEAVRIEDLRNVLQGFEAGMVMHAGDDLTSADYTAALNSADAEPMRDAVRALVGAKAAPQEQASAVEFILEGLHLSKRLNKDAAGNKATYRGR
jgi:magnesium chelatase subunit I